MTKSKHHRPRVCPTTTGRLVSKGALLVDVRDRIEVQ